MEVFLSDLESFLRVEEKRNKFINLFLIYWWYFKENGGGLEH